MVIDSNSLKNNSGFRRRSVEKGWTCHHCRKVFVLEKAFMTHSCKEKRRAEEMKTIIGQVAYGYYVDWMKAKKFKAPPIDTFISSRYYLAFMKFAAMAAQVNIEKPNTYINLMVRRDLSPTMWHRSQCYSIYLQFIDNEADPFELVANSIEKLERIAASENVNVIDIFNHLGFKRILELIRLRTLSPWLLLHSSKFKEFLGTIDELDLKLLMGIINIGSWLEIFEKKPEIRDVLTPFVREYGL